MKFGSLFAGIGGLDLGLERAGMTCAWQVEIDDFARKVLAKHWPEVPKWGDVQTFPPEGWDCQVDLICFGFPCQDISQAGQGAGLQGSRSGLFYDSIRIAKQVRPRWLVIENVAALLTRGFDAVLWELAEIGFDCEWHCIPATYVGATHRRDRVFVIANSDGKLGGAWHRFRQHGAFKRALSAGIGGIDVALDQWQMEAASAISRMDDGFSGGLYKHRVRGLGNAVVPQVAELVGRYVMMLERGEE